MIVPGKQALEWLKIGNDDYIHAKSNHKGDISIEKRLHTHKHGQNPYAVIITCSDSRVIPENIFMAGLGDLFVIRLAGNVIDDFGIGSIEYAVSHLNTKLVVVLGHTMCGAVKSAILDHHESFISSIIKEIQGCIGDESDPTLCSILNVKNTKKNILKSKLIRQELNNGLKIVEAIYHTHSGHVEFLK